MRLFYFILARVGNKCQLALLGLLSGKTCIITHDSGMCNAQHGAPVNILWVKNAG
jgi:hypothetical protein